MANTELEVIYYVAASVDGYIATLDGGVEWLYGFESSGEDYGYPEFYASVDALVLGSRAYEQCLTFTDWPYPAKPCWVFSRRDLEVTQPFVTVTAETPENLMQQLEQRNVRRVWLVGGAKLAASFRAQGLITEYAISVIPVVLGAGIPLFASPGPQEPLQLIESKSYGNGIVQLSYSAKSVQGE